jgi:hypothetical protein
MVFTELSTSHKIVNEVQSWSQHWTVTSSCPFLSLKHYCFIRFQVLFRGVSQPVALFAEIFSLFSCLKALLKVQALDHDRLQNQRICAVIHPSYQLIFHSPVFMHFKVIRLGHCHIICHCLWRIANTMFSHQEVLYTLL